MDHKGFLYHLQGCTLLDSINEADLEKEQSAKVRKALFSPLTAIGVLLGMSAFIVAHYCNGSEKVTLFLVVAAALCLLPAAASLVVGDRAAKVEAYCIRLAYDAPPTTIAIIDSIYEIFPSDENGRKLAPEVEGTTVCVVPKFVLGKRGRL